MPPNINATGTNNAAARDAINELNEILHQWEEEHTTRGNDPVPLLIKLCELFELHANNFLKKDPDPFDDRHPVTSDPDSVLGQILRTLFKRDAFVNKLVNNYLSDTYFSSQGSTLDSTQVNTVACRLILDLLQGLDIPQVFRESETTVTRLFTWAEKAIEPLRTYATGLLSAAVDIPEIATNFRDSNAHLLPIMLNRLWDLMDEGIGRTSAIGCEDLTPASIPSRPFAHLNSGALCNANNSNSSLGANDSTPLNGSLNSAPAHANDPFNSDCSNSSWAEMSSYIVGSYQMFPLTRDTKVLFILRYLRPVGEYQESLANVFEYKALDLVFHYINVRKTCHARLSFEALRFLGSLLFHKKFCLEFVNRGGVQKLLQIPRPSLPADGVALCLWYLGYCEEAIEKMCSLPDKYLDQVVKYALWLIESGHPSGRTHSVMFFGLAFKFRAILDKFDEQDGLRKFVNVMSTMSILRDISDEDAPENPNETMMWQTLKHVCISIRCYFEAHLSIKSTMMLRYGSSQQTPPYKPLNVSSESVDKNIDFLVETISARAKWEPVDNFVKLNGVSIFLQTVAAVLDDIYSAHRSETAVSALDTLRICSIMPKVQLAFGEKIKIPPGDNFSLYMNPVKAPGFSVLLACTPDNNQPVNATSEVQRAALKVLVNCLCAPTLRPGEFPSVGTPSVHKKKIAGSPLSSMDIVNTSWDAVRGSNGIMYLLALLNKKLPIAEADSTRALACQALVGLSRNDNARQIMSKLPTFIQGELQLLMREPILQEKRVEHVKFQRHCLELINAVSGKTSNKSGTNQSSDISLTSIHRADIVAQTRIGYNKQQLLQLIQMHLSKEGLHSAAYTLQKEAKLPPVGQSIMPPPRALRDTPSNRSRSNSGTPRNIFGPTSRSSTPVLELEIVPSIPNSPSPSPNNSVIGSGLPSSSRPPTPLPIRVGRGVKRSLDGSPLPSTPTTSQALSTPTFSRSELYRNAVTPVSDQVVPFDKTETKGVGSVGNPHGVSLDGIVREYLTNQHALCQNPVVTCPTFDLFNPHRCPEPRKYNISSSFNNICHRLTHMSYPKPKLVRYVDNYATSHHTTAVSGLSLRALDRHFQYSRFRPTEVIRAPGEEETYLSCCFSRDSKSILTGTARGQVYMFTLGSANEELNINAHSSGVSSIIAHHNRPLILTSSQLANECALWNIEETLNHDGEPVFQFNSSQHAIFNRTQDKIVTTYDGCNVKIFDVHTRQSISNFVPNYSNHYTLNKADIHPSDDLILTDGVLFDVRTGKEIHKFDKINPVINGTFHRNGLEVISSSEVWDLRSFHLLRTVPALGGCNILFNSTNDIIFGVPVHLEDNEPYDTSFKVIDAINYTSVVTKDTRRFVTDLCLNTNDNQLAVIESESIENDHITDHTTVKIYNIAMVMEEDDDPISEDDEDDDDDDEDINSDSSDSDPNNDDDQMPSDDDQNDGGNNDSTAEDDSNDNDGGSDDDYDGNSDVSGEMFINFDDDMDDDSNQRPSTRSGGARPPTVPPRVGRRRGGRRRGAIALAPQEEEDDQWEDVEEEEFDD